ncbi:hypothetical protein PR048_004661 [Dryococelus australis]|uniref:Uncharacterized protein n=1 Tax=Dryococelus australis TaxID=614101 RepID=A0ABQ9I600_9NEOP|nr:hypothetical protein PR048_004661 [Dryococelus australis]
MWVNPFPDWSHEALGTDFASDWLLRAANGSLVVRLPADEGRAGAVVRLLTSSHQGESGSITGDIVPEFSRVGIVPDDATAPEGFLGISRFFRPLHSAAAPHSPRSTLIGSQDLVLLLSQRKATTGRRSPGGAKHRVKPMANVTQRISGNDKRELTWKVFSTRASGVLTVGWAPSTSVAAGATAAGRSSSCSQRLAGDQMPSARRGFVLRFSGTSSSTADNATLAYRPFTPTWVNEVTMEWRRNERIGGNGRSSRKHTDRHNSHLRESGSYPCRGLIPRRESDANFTWTHLSWPSPGCGRGRRMWRCLGTQLPVVAAAAQGHRAGRRAATGRAGTAPTPALPAAARTAGSPPLKHHPSHSAHNTHTLYLKLNHAHNFMRLYSIVIPELVVEKLMTHRLHELQTRYDKSGTALVRSCGSVQDRHARGGLYTDEPQASANMTSTFVVEDNNIPWTTRLSVRIPAQGMASAVHKL